MDTLVSKLNQAFDTRFPGSKLLIGPAFPDSPRVGGYIVWDDFENQTQREWQAAVWNVIRTSVSASDQQRITAILTLTGPEEQGILENE